MLMNEIIEHCAKGSPVTVMARLALQHALKPAWLDKLFERKRGKQYERELLFSRTVELMSLVAVGLRPSLHAAARECPELGVSLQALYDKVNHTEPNLVRALVTESAMRLDAVLAPMIKDKPLTAPGYRVRIVDGSHLPATEKRLKPLRGFGGAPLPGYSLIIYDPDDDLIHDIEPCEDAYTQERALMSSLLDRAMPGELWIADRAFSTRTILSEWDRRGCNFIVREHSSTPNPTALGDMSSEGLVETGVVFEQTVEFEGEAGNTVPLRRIELRLNGATDSGEKVIRILTNLPGEEFTACEIARLYRKRWKIETLFQRLESVLHSEVKTLGHPRVALFAFGVAVMAYNVLSVIQAAISQAHDLASSGIELSPFYVALEVKSCYAGMMMATTPAAWAAYDAIDAPQLSRLLLEIAVHARIKALRKNPTSPKKPKEKSIVSAAEKRRHVSTARVLKAGFVS
ncbi:IS4 family transposase [Massilia sp. CFBP 13647]|nr:MULTISPECIES: IS4 family transposase [unclassified Massilia]MBD8533442.1 IS4 family transposase [Massilia sp. CFBP 13647]MBD8676833.1 IS4 family transposase [Massilia sp. CFBP 13721]